MATYNAIGVDRGALTRREIDVLALAADGRSTKEIATDLGIALWTVKHHMTNARAALHARNRTHVVAIAIRAGML